MQEIDLGELGWTRFFQQQLSAEEAEQLVPARVVGVQRTGLRVLGHAGEHEVVLGGRWFMDGPESRPTVGDWLLLDRMGSAQRLLDRRSVFKRVAPGGRGGVQLLAANVDVVFIVSSCNEEFKPSRLERYLALAIDANVEPVIVLTKTDLADDVDSFVAAAQAIRPGLKVEAVNALDAASLAGLRAWCTPGQTVALMGSSGVGKSTLLNTLSGEDVQQTGAIRAADGRGRHITSHRSLHILPDGGLLLDSPGLRELQIVDSEQGVAQMFDDIDALERRCRFSDCAHDSEPGCAIQAALLDGTLDVRRLENYYKLSREEARNTESLVERHQRVRRGSKQVRQRNDSSHKKR
ncbi:MAG: ribosome small subunit-dependent GTPase A [Gammaproteobacteria bacterium]|nr:MAG: ribosome small subunit-dependent GTPase A [Gammaproteobacteria bacterium]